jgi:hypothetical protein
MAKVVYGSLKTSKPGRGGASVTTKRITDAQGNRVTLYTVDAESRTLGEDLSYAFAKNVAKARRENKRLFGSADRAPAKS